jgi:serine/threonine protein kinase
MPQSGELLGDRYRLDDRIAAGGMGEVWRATDTVLGRAVAVKTLLAGYAGDAGFRTRFQHEARALASLRHASVVPVYDFGDTGDGAYLVMARVDGQPLNQRIAERGSLSPAETMSVVAQAARALAAAHEAGIVHRDVKPGNLIIEPDGTVVLVDFGVARSAHSVTLTGAKEVVGTALYIAPEQVSKQSTGPSVDIYALGAVAYHCLAGRPPFLGDNPLAVALQHMTEEPEPLPDSVPGPVRDLVAKAMAKDPDARFPSAAAMADAAGDLMSEATAEVPRPDAAGGTVRFAPGIAGAGAAPLLAPSVSPGAPRTPLADTAVNTGAWPPPNDLSNGPSNRPLNDPANGVANDPPNAPPSGPPGPANGGDTPAGQGGRRNLVLLSALLVALLGTGILIAVADPFGFFPGETPASVAPREKQSQPANPGATKDKDDKKNNTGGNTGTNDDNDQQREPSPSPTPSQSQRTSAPAETATSEPATTDPTTPADDDPTTATTEPETTTAPAGQPGEEEDDGGGGEEAQPEAGATE